MSKEKLLGVQDFNIAVRFDALEKDYIARAIEFCKKANAKSIAVYEKLVEHSSAEAALKKQLERYALSSKIAHNAKQYYWIMVQGRACYNKS